MLQIIEAVPHSSAHSPHSGWAVDRDNLTLCHAGAECLRVPLKRSVIPHPPTTHARHRTAYRDGAAQSRSTLFNPADAHMHSPLSGSVLALHAPSTTLPFTYHECTSYRAAITKRFGYTSTPARSLVRNTDSSTLLHCKGKTAMQGKTASNCKHGGLCAAAATP